MGFIWTLKKKKEDEAAASGHVHTVRITKPSCSLKVLRVLITSACVCVPVCYIHTHKTHFCVVFLNEF